MTSTEHPAPSSKRRRGSAIHQWRGPPVNANANGTGWANQLTCSLVQLSRSTRGCASTEVGGQRPEVKGRSKEEWNTGRIAQAGMTVTGTRVTAGDADSVI